MTGPELTILVPTRTRPHHVVPVVEAWKETGAFDDGARLMFVIDGNDPQHEAYLRALSKVRGNEPRIGFTQFADRKMLVPKLNAATEIALLDDPFAVGFAGDDHMPRTPGWARDYLLALRHLETGFVSCPDGYRSDRLPTQWAMTADVARAFGGRQVPAPVEHLYCDDAIRAIAEGAAAYEYLGNGHLIEHMHPVTGKVTGDAQHRAMNSSAQYSGDRRAYREWQRGGGLANAIEVVRSLREETGETS